MDEQRFDALSRVLAGSGSRRRVMRAIAAIAAGGTVASLEVGGADARPALCRPGGRYCTWNHQCCNNICRTGKRYPWRTRNVCECLDPDGWCGNVCTKLGTDKKNCGTCGHKCLPGEVCHDGQCWRQLRQSCNVDNIHDHECEPDLTCEHKRDVCVGPYEWIGCGDDDLNCDHDLVCRGNQCLWPGDEGEVCEQDTDCGENLLCDVEVNECVPACKQPGQACASFEDCCTEGYPNIDCVERTITSGKATGATVGAAKNLPGSGNFCCNDHPDGCTTAADCCYTKLCETTWYQTSLMNCSDSIGTGNLGCEVDTDCDEYTEPTVVAKCFSGRCRATVAGAMCSASGTTNHEECNYPTLSCCENAGNYSCETSCS